MGRALWEWVCERAPSQILFLRYMAKGALERHVPLGFFGGFVVERSGTHKDTLDLKARGIFPDHPGHADVRPVARGADTNTLDRLAAAGRADCSPPRRSPSCRDAYEVMARLRLRRQLACLDAGAAPDNFIDPRTLGKADRLLLKEAFKTIAWVQRHLEDRFQTSVVT